MADVVPETAADAGIAWPVAVLFLTSLLLLDPADMSLAGPVADVREIFSSSNSAGPVNHKMSFMPLYTYTHYMLLIKHSTHVNPRLQYVVYQIHKSTQI